MQTSTRRALILPRTPDVNLVTKKILVTLNNGETKYFYLHTYNSANLISQTNVLSERFLKGEDFIQFHET